MKEGWNKKGMDVAVVLSIKPNQTKDKTLREMTMRNMSLMMKTLAVLPSLNQTSQEINIYTTLGKII